MRIIALMSLFVLAGCNTLPTFKGSDNTSNVSVANHTPTESQDSVFVQRNGYSIQEVPIFPGNSSLLTVYANSLPSQSQAYVRQVDLETRKDRDGNLRTTLSEDVIIISRNTSNLVIPSTLLFLAPVGRIALKNRDIVLTAPSQALPRFPKEVSPSTVSVTIRGIPGEKDIKKSYSAESGFTEAIGFILTSLEQLEKSLEMKSRKNALVIRRRADGKLFNLVLPLPRFTKTNLGGDNLDIYSFLPTGISVAEGDELELVDMHLFLASF